MYTIPDPRSQCDLILFPFHGVPLTENPAPFFLRDDEMNLGIRIHTYISTCLCIILSWSLLCAHYYRAKVMLEELPFAFSACLSQNYKLCRASCRKDVKALFTSRQERKNEISYWTWLLVGLADTLLLDLLLWCVFPIFMCASVFMNLNSSMFKLISSCAFMAVRGPDQDQMCLFVPFVM